MNFLDTLSFWEILLRLVKYLSLAATAYFAWYGAAHETRDDKGNLTKAGRKVVRGVLVSLFIGFISQVAEDKQKSFEADQAAIKEDSVRRAYDRQRSIDDSNRTEQMDRLEAILGRSSVTLDRLAHQDTVQSKLLRASVSTLGQLDEQNKLQQKTNRLSTEALIALTNQTAISGSMLKKLSVQDTLQRGLINDILAVNKGVTESAAQLNNLMSQQSQLLSQANAQLFPINPITISIEYRHPIDNYVMPTPGYRIAESLLPPVLRTASGMQLRHTIKTYKLKKSVFWAIKFYKKLPGGGWAQKAGLSYLIDSKNGTDETLTIGLIKNPRVLNYQKMFENPERLIFKKRSPNRFYSYNDRENYLVREFLAARSKSDPLIDSILLADVVNQTGAPTIYNLEDLIGCRVELETIFNRTDVEFTSVILSFKNNKSILLKRETAVNTRLAPVPKNGILGDPKVSSYMQQLGQGTLSNRTKSVFTSVITKDQIGLFSE
jgi:hypothetical protein